MDVYTCLYCKKSFKNDIEFGIHRKTHRDINLKCEHCENVFDNKKEASAHYLNKHGLKFFKCEFNFCHLNYEHSNISSYKMHMLTTRHTYNNCEYFLGTNHDCKICEISYTTASRLKRHNFITHKENNGFKSTDTCIAENCHTSGMFCSKRDDSLRYCKKHVPKGDEYRHRIHNK